MWKFSAEPIRFVCDRLLTFWAPSVHAIFCTLIFLSQLHELWFRHFRNDVTQLSYRHASICTNFFFNFPKKVIRDRRWPTTPLFIVNISPSFGQFMAPLRHILPIHNVTINSNNLFVNFCWTFTFCVEKSCDRMHLAFGGTLDWHCHFKHIPLKQSWFFYCQTSTAHR